MSTATTTSGYRVLPVYTIKPSFTGLVGGELFKTVRQWTTWILLVLLLGILFLPYLIMFTTPHLNDLINSPSHMYFYGRVAAGLALLRAFGGIALLIVTARVIGQEYSLGTIRVLLARGVGRVQLLLAKMTAMVIWAIFLLIVGLAAIALLTVVQIQLTVGNLAPLTSLPASVWHDLGLFLLTLLISAGATVCMATALSVVFHSLAGALSGAIAWFPVDNALVLMLLLMSKLTNSDFWLNVTAYLLGPNLNAMAGALVGREDSVWMFGFTPQVKVDGPHTLLVTLAYALVFVIVAVVVTWKRDVKE